MKNVSYYLPFNDKSARKGACYAYVWPKRAPYDEMHYGYRRRYLKHVEPEWYDTNKWKHYPQGPPQRISCAKAFQLEKADAKRTGRMNAYIACPKGEEKRLSADSARPWEGGRTIVQREGGGSYPFRCRGKTEGGGPGECKITNWKGKVFSDDVRHIGSGTDNMGGQRDFYRFKMNGEVWSGWGVGGCGAYLRATRTKFKGLYNERDYKAEYRNRKPTLQAEAAKRRVARAKEAYRLRVSGQRAIE